MAGMVLSNLPEESQHNVDSDLVHVEPYCGSDTDLQETGLGHSPDVALSLTDRCKLKKGLH